MHRNYETLHPEYGKITSPYNNVKDDVQGMTAPRTQILSK